MKNTFCEFKMKKQLNKAEIIY